MEFKKLPLHKNRLKDFMVYMILFASITISSHAFSCTVPLSGNYTINATGTGDYLSFTEAVNDLDSCGINGPVIFTVDSGTYNEQIIIPAISGASSTNTITFTSMNPEHSVISYEDQVTSDRYVIQLDGTSHLTIDNLGIRAEGNDFGWGIHLTNNADSINITDNIILLDMTNTLVSNFGGIISSNSNTLATSNGENANNILIEGNTIIGGYHNIRINGLSTNRAEGIEIRNNILQDAHAYGIYTDQLDEHIIFGNEITRPNRSVSAVYYGIRVSNANQFEINSNKIYDIYVEAPSTTFYGVYVNASAATASNPNLIANNLIYNIDNPTSISYVIRHLASDFTNVYHNTISLDNENKTSANYLYYHSTASDNIEVKNNIFETINTGTGIIRAIWFAQTTTGFVSDNNVINIEGSGTELTIGRLGFTNYADLPSWQNASLQDGNSVVEDPEFANKAIGIYIPTNPTINDIGDPTITSIVPLDIDGETRGINPDPGAYEFTPPDKDISLESIAAPLPDDCYTATETAEVWILNNGLLDLDFADDSLEITLTIDGIIPQNFTTTLNTGTLLTGDSLLIEVTDVLDMSLEGLYEFTFIANMTDDGNPFNDTLFLSINRSPGVIVTNNTEICIGEDARLTLTDFSGPVQWQTFDGTSWNDLSGETQDVLEITVSVDTILVRALVCGNLPTATTILEGILVSPPVIADENRCGPGNVTFIATDNIFDGVRWFADSLGNDLIADGDSFTVFVNGDSTFYAQSFFGDPAEDAGKSEPTSTAGSSGNNWGLVFDIVNQDVVVESVDIYSIGAGGTIEIELQDALGNTIEPLGPFTYSAGTTTNPEIVTLELNLDVPVGNDYRLIATNITGGNIIRDFAAGNDFPYASQSGNVVVTSGYINGVSQTYYWFYNWQVGSSCDSDIVAVEATLSESDNDIAINSIISPLPNACYTNSETVEIVLQNAGVLNLDFSIDTLEIEMVVDGVVSQTILKTISSGMLNVGDTLLVEMTDMLDMSLQGTYNFSFTANLQGDCNDFNDTISQVINISSGEILAEEDPVCFGEDVVLELQNYFGVGIQWQILDGTSWVDVTGETQEEFVFTVITDSTYIRAIVCGDLIADSVLIEGALLGAPVVADVSRCGPGVVNLIATDNIFDGVRWFSDSLGNNLIAEGDTFSPFVSSDTVFYAGSTGGGAGSVSVGPVDNTFGSGGNYTAHNHYLVFDVFEEFTLDSVTVYPSGAGNVEIVLQDANSNVLQSATRPVSGSGEQRIFVGFEITPGIDYRLGSVSGGIGLYRNNGGASYPYEVPGVVSITTSTFNLNSYYFFYNWLISSGCESEIAVVEVEVTQSDIDIAVASIISPLPYGCYTNSETVELLVSNVGIFDIDFSTDSLEVELIIDGAIPQTFTKMISTGNLNLGDSLLIEVTDMLDLSAEGTYEFSFRATIPGDCNDFNDTISQTISVISGEILVNNTELCIGSDETLELVNAQGPIQWQTLDGSNWIDVPGETGTIYDFVANADSTFIRAITCEFSSDTILMEGIFVAAPVIADVTRCGPGDVTLTATDNIFEGVRWYSDSLGNDLIAQGDSLNVTVTGDSIFYTRSLLGGGADEVGKNAPTSTSASSGNNWGLIFDVLNTDMTIETVDIYSVAAAGDITIVLNDDQGNLIETVGTFPYPSGTTASPTLTTLQLDLDVPVGTDYRLIASDISGGNLIREFTAQTNYPYVSTSGNVVITSGFTSIVNQSYYWFFNWQISSGCESELTPVTVTVTEPDTIAVPSDFALCAGSDQPWLHVSSPNPDYVYSWSPINSVSAANGDSVLFTPTSGQHNIIVSATDPNTGCNAVPKSFTVTVLQEPTISLTASEPAICNGEDVILDIDAAIVIGPNLEAPFTINWFDPTLVNNPDTTVTTANPSVETTYSVYITDALGGGCTSDTVSVTVDVNEIPVVDLGPDQAVCLDEIVILDAGNDSLDILWSTGETTSTIVADDLDNTYSVIVTDAIGCTTLDTVTISSIPVPDTGIDPLVTACENESFVLAAAAGLASYNWTGDITSTDQEISFAAGDLAPGVYEYEIEVINNEGCNAIETGTVEIYETPVADLGPDTLICLDESIVLDAGFDGVTYQWTGQQLSSNRTITVNGEILGLGTFTYNLVITTPEGCQTSDQINVQVDQCIGIAAIGENRYGINTYPNPTSDKVYIEVSNFESEELYYFVHDALGRSISDLSGRIASDITEIDLSELANGVYFIKVIENNTSVYYDKVILK